MGLRDSFLGVRSAVPAAALSLLLASCWLAGLFAGRLAGGALHLLLAAAVALFPWKALRA
ncbi:MAG TPA: hypothetical protein VIH93_11980 [Thermoanaerobaculia bacterium]